jgi:hypothetical protein
MNNLNIDKESGDSQGTLRIPFISVRTENAITVPRGAERSNTR